MRTNLIFQFHCSECGALLNIHPESEGKVESEYVSCDMEKPRLPTGGEMLKVPSIQIEPCRKCITKYTGPAKALALAVKDLQAIQ